MLYARLLMLRCFVHWMKIMCGAIDGAFASSLAICLKYSVLADVLIVIEIYSRVLFDHPFLIFCIS